jgi:hypothetical protein
MTAEADVARVHVTDDFTLQDKYINLGELVAADLQLSTLRSPG